MEWDNYIGKDIAGCRLKKLIGKGAFGAVFRAVHLAKKVELAVKIHECPVQPDGSVDAVALKSIINEGEVLKNFRHPNIMKVFGSGVHDGTLYQVMELLKGNTLDESLPAGKPVPLSVAMHIGMEIATGLKAAHEEGLVHRDLKPSNIFIMAGTKLKILDFGMADAATGQALGGGRVEGGTPEYMAPEQWQKRAVDGRTDLYALGVILFRMTTGRLPLLARSMETWKEAHVNIEPPDARVINPEVPEGLDSLIRQMLKKNMLDRPESAAQVLESLQRYQHKYPELAPKSGPKTLLCETCETPNEKDAKECRDCGENLSVTDWSSDDLLPDL